MATHIRRGEFIATLSGVTASSLAARAQQPRMPVVGFLYSGTLKEAGFIEGQNVATEFHSGENQSRSRLLLVEDLLRGQ
jgi:putative ABC transport system substrate-binding protein